MEFYVVIPASGSGIRFGSGVPKQFLKYRGKEILFHTLDRFASCSRVKSVFLSIHPDYLRKKSFLGKLSDYKKPLVVSAGGATRQESVYRSLKKINCRPTDRIIVHDAVRPFLSTELIERLMDASKGEDCVIPGLKLHDTIKRIDKIGYVKETIDRNSLTSVQTPQIFRYDKLMKAFETAFKKKYTGTDEASLMEKAGFKVKVIEGEITNIKITTKKDIKLK